MLQESTPDPSGRLESIESRRACFGILPNMRKLGRDKVLIFTQYSLPANKRNMNAYQRLYYGSQHADIHLLIRRKNAISSELSQRVSVHKAPVQNRLLFFFYVVAFGMLGRFRGVDIVLTEPSKYALVGFVLKYLAGYFWVMDVWDPVWKERPGLTNRVRWRDDMVFWIMGRADVFLLSCLPQAATHIQPRPERSVQLYNAIDLSGIIADTPPHRSEQDPVLQLALARFRIGEKEGFRVLLGAAELLKSRHAKVKIHVIGHLDEESARLLAQSPATDLFELHGFITESRSEFFRGMHVGLVPYLPVGDMCYIFPIKVLEHLSQGNVVVASNVPGLAAMIKHEHNGLLFEPGDSDDLTRCILRLYEDRTLWATLATHAIETVKRYDPAVKNQTIFAEIAKRKSQGSGCLQEEASPSQEGNACEGAVPGSHRTRRLEAVRYR